MEQSGSDSRGFERKKRISPRVGLTWRTLWGSRVAALILLAGIVALATSPDAGNQSNGMTKHRANLSLFMPSPAAASQQTPCLKHDTHDRESPTH